MDVLEPFTKVYILLKMDFMPEHIIGNETVLLCSPSFSASAEQFRKISVLGDETNSRKSVISACIKKSESYRLRVVVEIVIDIEDVNT